MKGTGTVFIAVAGALFDLEVRRRERLWEINGAVEKYNLLRGQKGITLFTFKQLV